VHVTPLAGTDLCEAPHFQYHAQQATSRRCPQGTTVGRRRQAGRPYRLERGEQLRQRLTGLGDAPADAEIPRAQRSSRDDGGRRSVADPRRAWIRQPLTAVLRACLVASRPARGASRRATANAVPDARRSACCEVARRYRDGMTHMICSASSRRSLHHPNSASSSFFDQPSCRNAPASAGRTCASHQDDVSTPALSRDCR
jgi:hypothetical protein